MGGEGGMGAAEVATRAAWRTFEGPAGRPLIDRIIERKRGGEPRVGPPIYNPTSDVAGRLGATPVGETMGPLVWVLVWEAKREKTLGKMGHRWVIRRFRIPLGIYFVHRYHPENKRGRPT